MVGNFFSFLVVFPDKLRIKERWDIKALWLYGSSLFIFYFSIGLSIYLLFFVQTLIYRDKTLLRESFLRRRCDVFNGFRDWK